MSISIHTLYSLENRICNWGSDGPAHASNQLEDWYCTHYVQFTCRDSCRRCCCATLQEKHPSFIQVTKLRISMSVSQFQRTSEILMMKPPSPDKTALHLDRRSVYNVHVAITWTLQKAMRPMFERAIIGCCVIKSIWGFFTISLQCWCRHSVHGLRVMPCCLFLFFSLSLFFFSLSNFLFLRCPMLHMIFWLGSACEKAQELQKTSSFGEGMGKGSAHQDNEVCQLPRALRCLMHLDSCKSPKRRKVWKVSRPLKVHPLSSSLFLLIDVVLISSNFLPPSKVCCCCCCTPLSSLSLSLSSLSLYLRSQEQWKRNPTCNHLNRILDLLAGHRRQVVLHDRIVFSNLLWELCTPPALIITYVKFGFGISSKLRYVKNYFQFRFQK